MSPPLHRFSVSTRKFDCGCRSQGRNGSCSPGRIRPGLRAKRAMKTVCVGTGRRADSRRSHASLALRGADAMRPPLHRFSVSTRKFDCGCHSQGKNRLCSPGRDSSGVAREARNENCFVGAGCRADQTMHASLALRGGRMSRPYVSTRKFDCGCRSQGKNRLCSPGRIVRGCARMWSKRRLRSAGRRLSGGFRRCTRRLRSAGRTNESAPTQVQREYSQI